MTIWPTVVGIGIRVGSPENARTFANSAIHTGSGLRSSAFARRPQPPHGSPSVRACSSSDGLLRLMQSAVSFGRHVFRPQDIQNLA